MTNLGSIRIQDGQSRDEHERLGKLRYLSEADVRMSGEGEAECP